MTTPDPQMSAVTNACREFREHWRSFKHLPFPCEFLGTLDDIRALDYLDYEGLGYPPSHWTGSALVWGHVLQQQLGMSWAYGYNGEQILIHEAPGHRLMVWPFARVLEVQERSLPQFGRYAWLLDRAIRECLQYGDLSDDAIAWSHNVLKSWEQAGEPWR